MHKTEGRPKSAKCALPLIFNSDYLVIFSKAAAKCRNMLLSSFPKFEHLHIMFINPYATYSTTSLFLNITG